MSHITNFAQAHAALSPYISNIAPNGNYTLECVRALMEYLGNPQNSLRVIHVAGTSGKTSTTYYIASLLSHAGYRVGHSVSPHIDEVNERAQIDLQPLQQGEYCAELDTFLHLVEKSGIKPSYFEVLVAFAYWLFAKRNVDFAVIEVGLGGLLDGTNVVNRADKICVITDIGYDHMAILGTTLPEITVQKAGIIQPKNPVFMHEQAREIMAVVERRVAEQHALLHVLSPTETTQVDASFLPPFQRRNASLALAVVSSLLPQEQLTNSVIDAALHITIPGRLEKVAYAGKTVVFDGAHNPQKIRALVEAAQSQFAGKSIGLLVSFGENKRDAVQESLVLLKKVSDVLVLTEFAAGQDEIRTPIQASQLREYARLAGFSKTVISDSPAEGLGSLIASDLDIIIVTGSFYLMGDLRPGIFGA